MSPEKMDLSQLVDSAQDASESAMKKCTAFQERPDTAVVMAPSRAGGAASGKVNALSGASPATLSLASPMNQQRMQSPGVTCRLLLYSLQHRVSL
jgi:hypothetical protein